MKGTRRPPPSVFILSNNTSRSLAASRLYSCGSRAIRACDAATELLTTVSLAAKPRLSRSGTLGTHTRSTQAHLRAVQSSPPRPLGLCIADMQSPRASEGLTRHTHTRGSNARLPATTRQLVMGSTWGKKEPGRYPTETHADHRARLTNHRQRH